MAKKRPSFTTPVGRFVFPHLNTPDTKFDSVGTFHVDLNPDDADAGAALKAQIEAWVQDAVNGVAEDRDAGVVGLDPRQKKAWDNAVAKLADDEELEANDPPIKEQSEEYGGGYLFHFKMKPVGRTRNGEEYDRKPRLFDAQGQPIDVLVRNGSRGIISFEPYLYYSAGFGGAGVSLRLKAAQIVELAEGAADAGAFGFEAVDGFSIDEDAADFDSGEDGDEGYDFG